MLFFFSFLSSVCNICILFVFKAKDDAFDKIEILKPFSINCTHLSTSEGAISFFLLPFVHGKTYGLLKSLQLPCEIMIAMEYTKELILRQG